MTTRLLDTRGPQPRPVQPLPGGLALARGRVHEVCGMARRTMAALVMAESSGPVLWVHPGWQAERIFPDGLRDLADPGRVIFARARRPEDILWSAEEALRSGAVPLVVVELPAPPALTPVRRLHLAAEAGAEAARGLRPAPLGLLLTPGEGGAAGVESRWRLDPAPTPGPGLAAECPAAAWRLDRLRARIEPPATWAVLRDGTGRVTLRPQATA